MSFTIKVVKAPLNKIGVIKDVRDIAQKNSITNSKIDLGGLKGAKEFVEGFSFEHDDFGVMVLLRDCVGAENVEIRDINGFITEDPRNTNPIAEANSFVDTMDWKLFLDASAWYKGLPDLEKKHVDMLVKILNKLS